MKNLWETIRRNMMIDLLKNEICKLRRQGFLLFLLLLATFPVILGGARTIMGGNEFELSKLFFFANNQISMFFPVTIFILVGSLFYIEYKNGTYINYITYGYSKTKLFLSKIILANLIGILLSILTAIIFSFSIVVANKIGVNIIHDVSWTSLMIGYFIETIIIIVVTNSIGAIVINLSRSMVITSILGVIYGFVSALFIGMDFGYFVSGSFAYRLSMYFIDATSYYDNPEKSTIIGIICVIASNIIFLIVGMNIFSRKKTIER